MLGRPAEVATNWERLFPCWFILELQTDTKQDADAFLRHLACGVDSHDPKEQAVFPLSYASDKQRVSEKLSWHNLPISNRAAHRLWYLLHSILMSYSIYLKHRLAWELLAQPRFLEAVFSCVCFLFKCSAFRGSILAVTDSYYLPVVLSLSVFDIHTGTHPTLSI